MVKMPGKKFKPIKIAKQIQPVQPVRYNLACGNNKQDGFIGIDQVKTLATDIVMDLETFPWAIESDSTDELYCSHYVEHTRDLILFMDECHRILKTGCKMMIIAPYYSSMRACQDPTHKRSICEVTFMYFNKGWRVQNGLDHYDIKSDFDFTYGYSFYPEWLSKHEEARNYAILHYWNVVSDIQIVLTKR